MGEAFNAIRDTPIPTILILAGLFFILLAFVDQIGGVISASKTQKQSAIFVGLAVLTTGLVINYMPFASLDKPVSEQLADPSINQSIVGNPTPPENPTPPTEKASDSEPAVTPSTPNERLAVISDPDGYTYIRSGAGLNYEPIGRVVENETFYTTPQQGEWWPVRTKDNVFGYMHSSRISLQAQD